ncbi:MAG: molybdopterin dinucleotide-binding protein [Candidatus Lokiarchaeota archaeon]|nr:molybdopterin dinucleotide-binding protein [Candidatus Lokiarchaeota archaeon]MBD3198938.1 molybdopterin dinucleotide-binding protein [Candidatus Lokiarchaeota archaeon]
MEQPRSWRCRIMSLKDCTLLTGRTINQGVALEGGKTTMENVRAAAICAFDKEDFKKLDCLVGTPVKITTNFGEVTVYSTISDEGPHPGIIFIPMGPWANQVVNPDSQSCGTPTYKGMKATVEVTKGAKVLDALSLIKLLKEA